MLTRIMQTVAVLISWPVLTVGACFLVACSNSLAVAQAINEIWTKGKGPQP